MQTNYNDIARTLTHIQIYLRIKEAIQVNKKSGYAVAINGSLCRDLDLIIVPFEQTVWPIFELIEELVRECIQMDIKRGPTKIIEVQHGAINIGIPIKVNKIISYIDAIIYSPAL